MAEDIIRTCVWALGRGEPGDWRPQECLRFGRALLSHPLGKKQGLSEKRDLRLHAKRVETFLERLF